MADALTRDEKLYRIRHTTAHVMAEAVLQLFPDAKIAIGGAPVTAEFCNKIGADAYAPDPQGLVEYLNSHVA